MAKILVIEDEPDIAGLIGDCLTKENHLVEYERDGLNAWVALKGSKFDVIVLDIRLPGVSGIELCSRYRKDGGLTPILMLTAKDSVEDKAAGFDVGADDYMTKPFHLKELIHRVRALLRRAVAHPSNVIQFGDIVIDPASLSVYKNGESVKLQLKEFRLLEFFARRPKEIFTAEELLQYVWESDTEAAEDTVRGHIKRLRKKLDDPNSPSIITTVYGVGYKLEAV